MPFKTKKGIALLTTIAALGVLCLLAVSFATITQLDQNATASYEMNVHSKLLANAGLHFASAKIREHVMQYGIASWDNSQLKNPYIIAQTQQFSYQYRLEVYETSGLLNLNHPDAMIVTNANDSSQRDYPLERMLCNLALYLGMSQAKASAIASGIIQNRPSVELDSAQYIKSGYKTVEHVKELAQIDQATFDILKSYVATHGWVNTKSIVYKKGGGYKIGKKETEDISIAQRAPVNVNAASKEVLAAVLCGIKADDGTEIDYDKALDVANYIVENRPFYTWDEFRQDLKLFPNINFKEAELIFIATTPNSHSRDFDEPGYYTNYISPVGHYSKSNVIVSNTEFCLSPLGCFSVRSTGEILQENKLFSKFTISSILKIFECYRIASEKDYDISCIKAQSDGFITGPFAEDPDKKSHDYIGNLLINFYSDPQGYKIENVPGDTMTASGGGGNIILEGIVNSPFDLTCAVGEDGKVDSPISLQWTTLSQQSKICHHLFYDSSANEIGLSSMLIGDAANGVPKIGDDIFYKANLKQDWKIALEKVLKKLYNDAALFFQPIYSNIIPKPGEQRIFLVYNPDLEKEFYDMFWAQVYDAFASGDSAKFKLPMLTKYEYEIMQWDGTAWVYVETKTMDFDATEYLKLTNPAYPYMELYEGIFSSMPQNIKINRPNFVITDSMKLTEYVNNSSAFLNTFDRSRWQKKIAGPFTPYACLVISVTPSTGLAPDISIKTIEFVENLQGKKKLSILSFNSQDDEVKMGATLNYWSGDIIQASSSGKMIFQPSLRTEAVYVGKLKPSVPGSSWWTLGTFQWTGYAPVEGTSIQVFCDGQEILQDGTWKTPATPSLYQKGDDIHFKVVLHNDTKEIAGKTQPMVTPFFEEISCLVMVNTHFYYYQEEWDY